MKSATAKAVEVSEGPIEIAIRIIEEVNGDRQLARQKLMEIDSVVEKAIPIGVDYFIRKAIELERRAALDKKDNQGSQRARQMLRRMGQEYIGMSLLEGYRLTANGLALKDAKKTDLLKEVMMHKGQSRGHAIKARWFKLLADATKSDKTVGECVGEDKAKKLLALAEADYGS